jgi:hypothetical protein
MFQIVAQISHELPPGAGMPAFRNHVFGAPEHPREELERRLL